jgi:hypothetical protein
MLWKMDGQFDMAIPLIKTSLSLALDANFVQFYMDFQFLKLGN